MQTQQMQNSEEGHWQFLSYVMSQFPTGAVHLTVVDDLAQICETVIEQERVN